MGFPHSITRSVTGDEINVEVQDVASLDCENTVGVVFILVALDMSVRMQSLPVALTSAQVWVAGVWVNSVFYSVLDGPCNVCT